MQNQDQKRDGGVLFPNDRRENERQPTHRGSITIAGAEYYLNGWIREGRNGKFLSLSVQPKTATTQQTDKPKPKAPAEAPFDDTIDF
jgi:hypothetical protein